VTPAGPGGSPTDRSGLPRDAARFARLGAVSALLAVLAGAFGAHALRGRLEPDRLDVFEVAVRYQIVHALALLFVAWAIDRTAAPLARAAGWWFTAGSVLFCGSLYAIALLGIDRAGIVTPFGGLGFMVGWACLAIGMRGDR
jgi:uncharacterized membrane protein YgdD (TMEM256/DUF423 family)